MYTCTNEACVPKIQVSLTYFAGQKDAENGVNPPAEVTVHRLLVMEYY